MTRYIDTSNWPEFNSLTGWGRLAGISTTTLVMYRRKGLLPGQRLKFSNELTISKSTIIKAFKIKPTTSKQ